MAHAKKERERKERGTRENAEEVSYKSRRKVDTGGGGGGEENSGPRGTRVQGAEASPRPDPQRPGSQP